MKPVARDAIIDYQTYEERRGELRQSAIEAKRVRRINVGDCFTFLFENAETVRYQVQEMMRTERIVREKDILHELDTYNELLGREGGLGCTLLIGIDDEAERDVKLRAWLDLLGTIYLELEDGRRIPPTWDARQVGEDRLSSVQYLQFAVGGESPLAMGITQAGAEARVMLTDEQREALAADLAG